MADKAAEFWANFEKETGEKVASRCLGEFFPEGDFTQGIWGLLVLTDVSLRFRVTPSDNTIFGLIRRPDPAKKAAAPLDIVIPLTEIRSVDAPKRGFLSRLFGSSTIGFSVTQSERTVYHFQSDAGSGFLQALQKRLQG
jgi:hypothetical protein